MGGALEANVTCTGFGEYTNNTGYINPNSMPPDIFVNNRLASWSRTYTRRYKNVDIPDLWQELGGRRLLEDEVQYSTPPGRIL